MRKKTFMATITILVFLISLVHGLLVVDVAKANPFFIFHQVDPVPGTIPPNITISSPQNNTVHYSAKISVSFNVSRPLLGTCNTAIIDIKYTLDSETTQAFSIWRGGSASNGWAIPEFNTTFTSPSLPIGNHQLTVTAEGVVYSGNMDIFFINSSSTTLFAIGTQPIQLSPTPTQTPTLAPTLAPSPSPSPTLTPTPSPSPSLNPSSSTNPSLTPSPSIPEFPTWIVIPLVLAATLMIIYKRKGNKR